MRVVGVIPARMESKRLPGKPLLSIKGRPLIQRVYEQALSCQVLDEIVIASDNTEILATAKSFGALTYKTASGHINGTERCAEVATQFEADYFINIQGDLAVFTTEHLQNLVSLCNGRNQIATLVEYGCDQNDFENTNVVKTVISSSGKALYFTRKSIAFRQPTEDDPSFFLKHVGMYAYRTDILQKIASLPKSALETVESLEQLRWLESGYEIATATCLKKSHAIDTTEDLNTFKDA